MPAKLLLLLLVVADACLCTRNKRQGRSIPTKTTTTTNNCRLLATACCCCWLQLLLLLLLLLLAVVQCCYQGQGGPEKMLPVPETKAACGCRCWLLLSAFAPIPREGTECTGTESVAAAANLESFGTQSQGHGQNTAEKR